MAPLTDEELAQRDTILALAEAKGVSQRELARLAGFPATNAGEQRISRWKRGEARLDAEVLERLQERLDAIPMPAAVPVVDGERETEAPTDLASLAALAGEADPDEKNPGAALARTHIPALVGGLLRLATSARSESVRLKALTELLDRAEGRPIQTIRETNDRPPIEDAELLFALERLVAQKIQARVAGATAEELPALEAEAAGLEEEHRDAVLAAVEKRRAALAGAALAWDGKEWEGKAGGAVVPAAEVGER